MADEHRQEPSEGSGLEGGGDSTFELLQRLRRSSKDAAPRGNAERYEVLSEIARGGMGVIFQVRDLDLRRSLAMKVLSDRAEGDPGATELDSQRAGRFLEEAQVTGQLEHPGIIPVHELGLDAQGRLFFTMRLVKGITLREVFERARAGRDGWSVTRALGVVLKVCEAMAFAHDKDVIHRDLKPANVMVGRFGETYVMDWGLAKLLGETEAESPARTDTTMASILTSSRSREVTGDHDSSMATLEGDVMGTPAYMPPEQARGDLGRMGPHSDIYSVGAMLYHLVTGHPPYSDSNENRSPVEILTDLLAGPPTPVERNAPDSSPELLAVCEKAMAREPGERYGSMLEMSEDLHAYLENRVVQAHRTGAVVEFKKWVARNKGIAASLAFALFAALAGLGGVGYVQARGREELASKNDELVHANSDLADAQQATERARDEALANAALARSNEERAVAQEVEMRWQSYVANIHAATALLEAGSAHEARARLEATDESLRDWEWSFLWNASSTSLRTLAESGNFVFAADFSPDGTRAASGGGTVAGTGFPDFKVRIYDPESGEILRVLEGHTANVQSVDFSPSGTELVTSGADGTARLWDVASGEEVARFTSFGGTAAYHPDGRHIVVGETTGRENPNRAVSVGIWDTYEDELVHRMTIASSAQAVGVSPRGDTFAVGSRDFGVRLFDWGSRRMTRELDAGGEHPNRRQRLWVIGVICLAFDESGDRLVAGGTDECARVWDLRDGSLISLLEHHRSAVFSAQFHSTAPWVVTSDFSSLRFFDIATSERLEVLYGHSAPVMAVDITERGDKLVSVASDRTLRHWDGSPGASSFAFSGPSAGESTFFVAAFSEDGTKLATRRGPGQVEVRDARSGELIFRVPLCQWRVRDAFFRANDAELCTVETSGRIRVWSTATLELLRELNPGTDVVATALSPDRSRLATSGSGGDRIVRLWDLDALEPVGTLTLPSSTVGKLAYSADGSKLVVEESAGVMGVWDPVASERLREFREVGGVHGMVAVPGTDLLAVSLFNVWDQELRLWDLETGALVRKLRGHGEPSTLDVSPDGRRLVSGCWDNTVILWDLVRGEIIALPGHPSVVGHVAFSPSGDRIASAGFDGTFRIWESTSPLERAEARDRAALNRRWNEEATKVVSSIGADYITVEDRLEALESMDRLDARVRDAARRLLRLDDEDARDLARAAMDVARSSDRVPDEYLRALRGAEKAVRLWPDPPELAKALGACQYRMGRYGEALASLQRAGEQGGIEGLAFTAMALAKAGMDSMASETLERLFLVYERATEETQQELGPLLDEAERTVR